QRRRPHGGAHARGGSERGERLVEGGRDHPARSAGAHRAAAVARAAPGIQRAGGPGSRGPASPRGRPGGAGDGGRHGQRGRPPAIARNALGIRPGGGVRRFGGARRRPGTAAALRVSSGIWLSYVLPDQCRDRAAGERAYPLAGPRLDEGSRESASGAHAGRTHLPWVIWGGERGRRELLSVV